MPPERFGGDAYGAFLDDADCFDAAFFNISPREAAQMDPQQRFTLEMAWHAIEDAGYAAGTLAGSRTGVFMGVCHWDYAELLEKHLREVDAYTPTGIGFSIIANRVSHFFDFTGPSVTTDTACAASLTSLHGAVRAIQNGECDMALAGGVNFIWSPNHFDAFAKAGMLSKDGHARVFDAGANGYVRGEGGAVLLLKPLAQAVKDRDPIHAVIKGIGINHGGRTNSLTVTNPNAQADLICDVYRAAGIAPDSIAYIEAHGTGTPLGDPIEIAGLKQALRTLHEQAGTQPRPGSTGIGSVKTTIGHLEGAAGVAGIARILAALRHDTLPAHAGFNTLNTLIDFSESPLRIQSANTPWPRSSTSPRRAAVSSFGFGGSNAHAVLEEAPAQETKTKTKAAKTPQIIPLSARDDERLTASARMLRAFIERQGDRLALRDLAWTLQTGREAMPCRLCIVAQDIHELKEALTAALNRQPHPALCTGDTPAPKQDKMRAQAQLWALGSMVDWPQMHPPANRPRRIHAPLYPFARERHWMDLSLGTRQDAAAIHPLLHTNLSGLNGIRYRTLLSGPEFFWADHRVAGAQLLPGTAYLEMARAAATQARGSESEACVLSDVVWAKPVRAAKNGVTLELRLARTQTDALTFAVREAGNDSDNCQGMLSIEPLQAQAAPLDDLRKRTPESLSPAECYRRLAASGVEHGPAFRILSEVRTGGGDALAQIKLPRRLHATLAAMPLHPLILDAAIQAWVALAGNEKHGAGVPFTCRRIEMHRPCEPVMWAHVRIAASQTGDALRRLDIDLYGKDGGLCVAMRDLALKLMQGAPHDTMLIATGSWCDAPLIAGHAAPLQNIIVDNQSVLSSPALRLPAVRKISLPDAVTAWYEILHRHITATLKTQRRERQQLLVLVPDTLSACLTQPLAALLKTASLEQPKLDCALVRVQGDLSARRLNAIAAAERARTDNARELRYDASGNRQAWIQEEISLPKTLPALDATGTYWITGGLGGLGQIFARWLMERGARRILLSGRADLSDSDPRLAALRAGGCEVRYAACDITDEAELEALVRANPSLKGIIHAAGVLSDAYMLTRGAEADAPVLAPKIAGTVNLDNATRNVKLDFFLLCSSVASTFGNAGQAGYAAANAFLDAFAERRAEHVAQGGRHGYSAAIAWPLWAQGGMRVDPASLTALKRHFGTTPMPSEAGLAALDSIVAAGRHTRITVLHGAPGDLQARLAPGMPHAAESISPAPNAPAHAELTAQAETLLRDTLADVLRIEPGKLRAGSKLEEYGLDSIAIVEATNRLEDVLGPLPKTLFFEYIDIASAAAHLAGEYGDALSKALMRTASAQPGQRTAPPIKSDARAVRKNESDTHDIAIVGLSLHVSKAANQKDFWHMLSGGLHGFEAVPKNRWDNDAIYHPTRDVLGKTVVKSGTFLDDIAAFDPRYFRISQAEAELMSPEVRLFLQASVEAFEDAGYSRESLQRMGGNVAVIMGSMTNEYDLYGFQNMLVRGALASGSYTGTIPNMVSYFYGLTGPSYFLDTMCAGSSTCVHEAVHMLRAGRCAMALAGGISLMTHPQKLIATSQEHFTSKTADVIRGYGTGADGTILGEGVGALVLKTRADAERDGDHIYGVIRGTAITNAGIRNGFTVPSPNQQAEAIRQALDDAGIDAGTISYIEGHGSGTALGDPIEIKALTKAFRQHTDAVQTIPIGTVKSNVGHLLAAAGVAGIIKVLMQLKHKTLAPSLHAETLNPNIDFNTTPFYVQRELAPWPRLRDGQGNAIARRAGVTSIGAGGVNSHMIIEEHSAPLAKGQDKNPQLLVFSAMHKAALEAVVSRMLAHLEEFSDEPLADLAWTLQTGKNELPCRLAFVAHDRQTLVQKLHTFLSAPDTKDQWHYTPSILEKDPVLSALEPAIASRNLDAIASLWADGASLDWARLHAGTSPRRLSLPSYPFERVRCWYQEFDDAPSVIHPLGLKPQPNAHKLPRDTAQPAAENTDSDLALELREMAAAMLKFPAGQISLRAAFHDLGFDSISLARLAEEISRRYGIALSPAVFFECEHLQALSAHLTLRHPIAPHRAQPASLPATAASAQTPGADGVRHIAVIGMAGRFPGAADTDTFFDRLLAGDDMTAPLPKERFESAAGFARHGGFLSDIDRFDAALFKISPAEAERMDPRQRLLLETTWRALEDAGYAPDELPRNTCVHVGASGMEYTQLLRDAGIAGDGFVATGNALSMLANRISHYFNLTGASETVDTACSSSLVALLRAADALRAGTCDAALAAGVNLALLAEGFEGPHQAGMLSADGRCKTFAAAADGYGRGEGVICVLLKRLEDAERDGDRILGVLIGGAENHGGRSGALTAPNINAQAELVARAMQGIDPAGISYIEAHGTGTWLGDPVEVSGLRRAYEMLTGAQAVATPYIGLGSVKSNIGHLEAAAGLAGLAKILMAMRRGRLPATLHCRETNPHLELSGSPFYLLQAAQDWPAGASPRRAGLSSFGFGGSNAHAVIESYAPGTPPRRAPLPPRTFADTRFWPARTRQDTYIALPVWREAAHAADGKPFDRRIVFGCEITVTPYQDATVITHAVTADSIGIRYAQLCMQLLRTLQTLPTSGETLLQLVVPLNAEQCLFAGLGAMLDTAALEQPHLRVQVIETDLAHDPAALARQLTEDAHTSQTRLRHRHGKRLCRAWSELQSDAANTPWRKSGVTLITGGMGALGRIVARDIARSGKGMVIVLTGTAPEDASRSAFLEELRALGAVAAYRRVDICDARAVKSLIDHIVEVHGTLNAIMHCAGVLHDAGLHNVTAADLTATLAPKVAGTLALLQSCEPLTLDACVLFSSLSGAVGNSGQAAYAAANGFMDALAESKNLPLISIDWPLWEAGGMQAGEAVRAALYQRMGQRPMTTQAGIAALHRILAAGTSRAAVVAGDKERIHRFFADAHSPAETVPQATHDTLLSSVNAQLQTWFAQAGGFPAGAIRPDEPLEDYGINSLMITRLNAVLADKIGPLPKTLFFEHRTLGEIGARLLRDHAGACRRWLGDALSEAPKAVSPSAAQEAPPVSGRPLAEPIAIIGISGRYPGANTLDAFWNNLAAGKECVGNIPAERWSLEGFYHADPDEAVARGMSYAKRGGFIEGFADFDPLFFKIAPRDAEAMDPQERLFLTYSWAAFEDAGYTRARLKGKTVGVYAGATKTGFALHGPYVSDSGANVRPATHFASFANRVSFAFDLSGPSLPVDTMCSSSLTAIHQACEDLRAGRTHMALAGGVNLYLHPSNFVDLCAARMLSPDGICRSFGKGANGFVPGEGVGCVVLKPLSRAREDGDRIHAIIHATAINHGGHTNGYTVPNPLAQRDLVRAALAQAGLNAHDIGCIEAHGTGTGLGDPIELAGLAQAFAADTGARNYCSLGSVKSGIGHLEAAAGIAGLTKTVLALRHGMLPPSLHADEANPDLDLESSPFVLQKQLAPWPSDKRIAGISSFGAGGANAHVIVGQAPQISNAPQPGAQAIVLSARDADRLREQAKQLVEALEQNSPPLADIAWTLQIGREAMQERLAVTADSAAMLIDALQCWLQGKNHPRVITGSAGEHRDILGALSQEAIASGIVAGWWGKGQVDKILALWVKGLDVDWQALPRSARPKIVSLPTYPFERRRFWIPVKNTTASVIEAQQGDEYLRAQSEQLDRLIAGILSRILERTPETIPALAHWRSAALALLAPYALTDNDDPWMLWEKHRSKGPKAQMALAETTLRALPDILTGKQSATSVMFPEGQIAQVEAVYKDNAVAARFSCNLAQAAEAFVRTRSSVRILEIGAGTGGTSEKLFDALAPHADRIAEYRYTDVSRAFLIHAERHYQPRWPMLSTALFDVEKPLAGQDVQPQRYDLVVAANVLHATADINTTLAHARALLAPGGILLMNETSMATLFTHVTFGLLDGWWRFTDAHRRIPGTPSLTPESWKSQLHEAGFEWLAGSGPAERALGQQLIAAAAPQTAAISPPVISAPAQSLNLRERLIALAGETLNIAPGKIDIHKPFADYGLDSILGAHFVHRIRTTLNVAMEHTSLFDFATIARLETFLATRVAQTPGALPAPSALPSKPQPSSEPIAIIGMSGRFAGSPDIDAFWNHLLAGRDLVGPVSRFDLNSFYKDEAPGTFGTHGSFIDGIDRFDAAFFGISGVEATYMDPQQRLFLEEAWKTLEHAGRAGGDMQGSNCGVFAGCSAGDYQDLFHAQPPGQAFWGNTSSLIPARIAYFLDLKGPAIAVDTACSSSLVAVHMACQSLRAGECDMALAGGVFIECTPRFFRYANQAGMLSPHGRCAAFGSDADGFVPGEAVGAVLLRPLSRALADGDTVYAVIVAHGTNQDGTTNGITAPSAASQQQLIQNIYKQFAIDPAGIGMVEAHGTGTRLGDPIEYEALARAFAALPAQSCALGSVKSNIGHATTAAGIAGLMRVLLSLTHRTIPPALHFGEGNPAIRFDDGPFHVNTIPLAWETQAAPRRAAISSFGFSGTNAHLVVQEPPPSPAHRGSGAPHLFVLCGRSAALLREQAAALAAHLERHTHLAAADVAFTLIAGRRPLRHRLCVIADDCAQLTQKLRRWLADDATSGVSHAAPETLGAPAPKANVEQLAAAWLSGAALSAGILYPQGGRRVALPATILASTRHWVDAPEAVLSEKPVAEQTARAAAKANQQKIRLADPAGISFCASPAPAAKTVLTPVIANKPATAPHITGIDAGDGVRLITVSGDAQHELARALETLAQDDTIRTAVITGDAGTATRHYPLPVIGTLPGADFTVTTEQQAVALAQHIAQAPRIALSELTQAMRNPLMPPQQPATPEWEALWNDARDAAPTTHAEPDRLPLSSGCVTLELYDDGVALLRMHEREQKNSFTDTFMDGISEAFAALDKLDNAKAVVLTGFDGYFACGGTAEGLTSLQQGASSFTDRTIYSLPLACRLPVIAAMQGHAIGAGWSLGMFCDRAVYAEAGIYHSNYLWFGFTPGAGATMVFPHRLGKALGWEILFTAREYRGRELAERLPGLQALPAEQVLDAALCAAHALARQPRTTLIALKSAANRALTDTLDATFTRELAMHRKTFIGNARVEERIAQMFPAAPPVAAAEKARETPPAHGAARKALIESLAEHLMIACEDISDSDSFVDLGMDSILAVTWIRKLNALPGVKLAATAVYSYPTIGALAGHVAGMMHITAEPLRVLPADKQAVFIKPVAPAPQVVAHNPQPITAVTSHTRSRASRSEKDAVAIIGASGRFPKSPTLAAFRENIQSKRDCIDEVPPERWDVKRYYHPDPANPGTSYCRFMGAIDGVELFDAAFFNITPREAELMDPQQRLFLQHAWQAFEDAAINPETLAQSRCGVFVGAGPSGYADRIDERNAYSLLGSSGSILAARIAHLLDLRGPCIALDTACSSSLVAIAEACDSLLIGNSDMALAGGVSVLIGPSMFIDTSKTGMLSASGRCYSFDQRASGFVPGEGAGVLLLKRLGDAVRDGDPVHAVIRGWGVNQDGKTNGITAPNPKAQTALIRDIHTRFGIDPASIGLIECHGTGTPLGDPIEVEGLAHAFAGAGLAPASVAIGSVKSNVGHLLAAAGVAGAIKAMFAVRHGELPPTMHFEQINEHIDLSGTPFIINTEARAWPKPANAPRRAGVSSFGFSGTNAHLVIEEYEQAPAASGNGPWIFTLSARSEALLREYARDIEQFVTEQASLAMGDLCHTLQHSRKQYDVRLAFVFTQREELLSALAALRTNRIHEGLVLSGGHRQTTDAFDDEETRALVHGWLASNARAKLGKVAELWAHGLKIEWPKNPAARRIHLPAAPFARERHWVAARVAQAAPATVRTQMLTGLSLPEMVRVELDSAHAPCGFRHLLWGKQTAGAQPWFEVRIDEDAQGRLYRVIADGKDHMPWHLGEILESGRIALADPLPLSLLQPGEDVSHAFLLFKARGDTLFPGIETVRISHVWRCGSALLARIIPGEKPEGFDPALLETAWQLAVFRAGAWRAEAEPGLLPLAATRLLTTGRLQDASFIRIETDPATSLPTITLLDSGGSALLLMDGITMAHADERNELSMKEDTRI